MDKGSSFWNRALRNARSAWDKIATDNDGGVPSISSTPGLNDEDRVEVIKHMQACLDRRGGEVSARKRAAALGHVYMSLNKAGRKRFLTLLTDEFGTDHDKVDQAVVMLSQSQAEDRFAVEQKLREALKAPRVQLLTQFNALPEGVKFLVDMREELIPWAKKDKQLRGLESDLKTLLTNWFDVGFLELRQITWEAPAALLEKLFIYEAVHEIKDWEDLKNRLASDRRCFAFFHPRMPDEPLIFVWVALVNGISDNVQVLLDHNAPQGEPTEADCAIFYSISNAQAGLSAINFGNFLIKRVVDQLSRELPNINTFATLSPIPGFRRWLDRVVTDGSLNILTAENSAAVMALCPGKSAEAAVNEVLSRYEWHKDDKLASALKDPLQKLAAHYLINEKRAGGTAENPVAHFHLNNGAIIAQIDWLADTSERGIKESAGMMINYLYKLKTIDNNHESYRAGEEVIASTRVRSLLKI